MFLRTQIAIYKLARVLGTATWVRWGLRYRIYERLLPIRWTFTVPFYGGVYVGSLNNFIDRSVFFYGAHEREVLEYMGSHISPESVVLDIGANVGHHTLFFALKAREVHAFEPNTAFREQFEMLMTRNHLAHTHLHGFGLGDKTESATYYAPTGDNQGVGSFVSGHKSTNVDVGTMDIVRGDEAVRVLNLSRIDFIKIDVERFEESVLLGLQETLHKFKPVVVMEYAKRDFASTESFLSLTSGYIPYVLATNKPFLFFFNIPRCKLEPFDSSIEKAELVLLPTESTL